jgi:hypothetical protein
MHKLQMHIFGFRLSQKPSSVLSEPVVVIHCAQ